LVKLNDAHPCSEGASLLIFFEKGRSMNRIAFTSAVVITFFLLSPTVQSADAVYDGHYWQQCPPEVKHLFVRGVMSGVLVGQDRVVGYALMNKGPSTVSPECHRAVVRVVNTLERQIEKWDRNDFLEAMDDFYEDPDNRMLSVDWAVLVVMLEMRGAPQDEIREYIEQLQRKPQ
jgi:hypothetical protein